MARRISEPNLGFFSIESGWNLISARAWPYLNDDREGLARIRRLMLDLARGTSEVVFGLENEERYNLNTSNRLDPYQVGVSILSAYCHTPLKLFGKDNSSLWNLTFADIIHACALKSDIVFKNKDARKDDGISPEEDEFNTLIMRFCKYIRDHKKVDPNICKLMNQLLAFCSVTRQTPKVFTQEKKSLTDILSVYSESRNWRLIQVSLKHFHKVATKLNLGKNERWGWSVIVTAAFEEAVNDAHRQPEEGYHPVFLGKTWLFTRSSGRSLFLHHTKSSWDVNIRDMATSFAERFGENLHEMLTAYCGTEKAGNEVKDFLENKLESNRDNVIDMAKNLVRFTMTKKELPISQLLLGTKKIDESLPEEFKFTSESDDSFIWVHALEFPNARGVRRFRSIQSYWQNLLTSQKLILGGNTCEGDDGGETTFVYLDCIQLSDLIWESDNWIMNYRTSRILAPLIEGSLAYILGSLDGVYPNVHGEQNIFRPSALGGDEIHLIVPMSVSEVEKILEEIGKIFFEMLTNDHPLYCKTYWQNKKGNSKLVLKRPADLRTFAPVGMWWAGILDLTNVDRDEIDQKVSDFSSDITAMKTGARKSWKGKKKVPFFNRIDNHRPDS
ncbi:MAG: hypothetical protein ACKVIR_05590 [Candidatus Poseidoniales archaeon]